MTINTNYANYIASCEILCNWRFFLMYSIRIHFVILYYNFLYGRQYNLVRLQLRRTDNRAEERHCAIGSGAGQDQATERHTDEPQHGWACAVWAERANTKGCNCGIDCIISKINAGSNR